MARKTPTSSANNNFPTLAFVPAQIPFRVVRLLTGANDYLLAELARAGSLRNACTDLTGAKMLLADVLELGMPYTLAHDDVLHGFLYGSESLTDPGIATDFLQTQDAQLQAAPNTPAPALVEWDWQSYLRFHDRLNQCLTNLQATGRPEIPRLVGHTLRLLNLLRDAWTQPANSPPPTLEMWSENHSPRLLLYGEPYMRYTLQYCDTLTPSPQKHDSRGHPPPEPGGGSERSFSEVPAAAGRDSDNRGEAHSAGGVHRGKKWPPSFSSWPQRSLSERGQDVTEMTPR